MIVDPRRREIFIAEYLVDFNGKRAAIACGSPAASAHARAHELLTDPEIKDEISKRVQARLATLEIDEGLILRELAALAYANMRDVIEVQEDGTAYVDLKKCPREVFAAISEINTEEFVEGRGENGRNIRKVKVKFHDKKGALELLGKYKKLWTDKQEVSGPDGQPLIPASIKVEFV